MSPPSTESVSPLTPESLNPKDGKFSVGSLVYSKKGLVTLFAWMLWGDFCFMLMEAVVPSILPLKLGALGASNTIIALIMTTMPGILNTTVCPWVSFRSDRHRGKWGRRIPFIIYTLPFLTLFLILLGFSEQIGSWVHKLAFAENNMFSVSTVAVFMIGIFMVGFQFFNMFVGSVFWYLFNDVVPEQRLGQFLGLFRTVSGLAAVLFNKFVLQYAETHMTEIFVGAALLYFIGFGLMCFKVKEGEYPPPQENIDGRKGLLSGIKTFCVECFSIRFYWYMFGVTAFSAIGVTASIFWIFFIKDIGLNLKEYGEILAIMGVVGMFLTYPAGIVADKYHPLRVQMAMKIILLFFTPMFLCFLFVTDSSTAYYLYMGIGFAQIPAGALYSAALLPALMRIFPKDRYGQFCSADAMVRSVGTIFGGLVAGGTFDLIKWYLGGSNYAYRWIPAWMWICDILAFICLFKVYQGWKKYGGLKNYVPPLPKHAVSETEPKEKVEEAVAPAI
jgi:MFS family permease